jgi:hypothetical protein
MPDSGWQSQEPFLKNLTLRVPTDVVSQCLLTALPRPSKDTRAALRENR